MGAQRSQSLWVYSQLASHLIPSHLISSPLISACIPSSSSRQGDAHCSLCPKHFLHSSGTFGSASNETVLNQDLVGFGGAGAPFPASVNEVSFHHHHRHQNSHAIHGNHHNDQTLLEELQNVPYISRQLKNAGSAQQFHKHIMSYLKILQQKIN